MLVPVTSTLIGCPDGVASLREGRSHYEGGQCSASEHRDRTATFFR